MRLIAFFRNNLRRLWGLLRKAKKAVRFYDKRYYKSILEAASKVPLSNGARYYQPSSVRVGIIADEFIWYTYKDAANFTYLTEENYAQMGDLDFVMIVSSWRGLDGAWRHMGKENSRKNIVVKRLISYYKARSIPVIFYSKEDPPNYHYFLNIAVLCDIVFTSCVEKLADYRRACGHGRVYPLKFCANPLLHNPVGMRAESTDVLFAGSWMNKYPRRNKFLGELIEVIKHTNHRLMIIDRNYYRRDGNYDYPFRYRKFVYPSVTYLALQNINKLFGWAVNINSVTESDTMFASRVYELLAEGTLVVSNYSRGMAAELPEAFAVHTARQAQEAMECGDEASLYGRRLAGIRRVLRSETAYHRFSQILTCLGREGELPRRTVVVAADELNQMAVEQFAAQAYPHRKLISTNELNADILAQNDMLAIWRGGGVYPQNWLEDMINVYKYTDADYVTENRRKIFDYVTRREAIYDTVYWCGTFTLEEILEGDLPQKCGFTIDTGRKDFENEQCF